MQHVVVVGGVNVDIKGQIQVVSDTLQTSHPGAVWRTAGGVGRNIAVNLAHLGANVRFVAPFGSDEDGLRIKRELDTLKIDTTWSDVIEGMRTGTYLAILGNDGNLMCAVSDMGLMDTFTAGRLMAKSSAFRNANVVCVDANLTADTLHQALTLAHEAGAPSVVEPVSVAKAQKLKAFLKDIHTITPNVDELASLVDAPLHNDQDVVQAAASLVSSGVKRVFVTMGARGVLTYTERGIEQFPVTPLNVVDATGAGDAFTAGVAFGYANGWDVPTCINYGQQLAAQMIQSISSVLGGA